MKKKKINSNNLLLLITIVLFFVMYAAGCIVYADKGFTRFQTFLNILINNAGFGRIEPFLEMSAAPWQKTLAVNVSDLAAMGAQPRWALLAGSLPAADDARSRIAATRRTTCAPSGSSASMRRSARTA